MYCCKIVPGNIDLKGSVYAELNHASIVIHFGDICSWTIVYHMHKLMEMQDYFLSIDSDTRDKLFMTQFN